LPPFGLADADADIIVDGHLIDPSTYLCALNKTTGVRSDASR
jgi:hypothetical protein